MTAIAPRVERFSVIGLCLPAGRKIFLLVPGRGVNPCAEFSPEDQGTAVVATVMTLVVIGKRFDQVERFLPDLRNRKKPKGGAESRQKRTGAPSRGAPVLKTCRGPGHVGAAFKEDLVAEAHDAPSLHLVEAQAVRLVSRTSKSLESL
jgi:hypothetical protein